MGAQESWSVVVRLGYEAAKPKSVERLLFCATARLSRFERRGRVAGAGEVQATWRDTGQAPAASPGTCGSAGAWSRSVQIL